jgi:hypothetical protein
MLKNDRYTCRVTWSEEDDEYVGLCIEVPSLSWLAPTPQEALEGIRQVVADVVADMSGLPARNSANKNCERVE